MKMFAFVAAALVASAAVMPAIADAGTGQAIVKRTTVTRTADSRSERSDRDDRGWRGRRTHWKKVCTNRWHKGRHIRTCRKTRVRW